MSLWTFEENENQKYDVKEDGKIVITIKDEEDAEKIHLLLAEMQEEHVKRETMLQLEIKALEKTSELCGKVIADALTDKLASLDTMYAMKMILKELESTLKNIETLKDAQDK